MLKSQTCSRLSVPEEAKMVSLWGDHCTWKISSLCDSKLCSFSFKLRKSHRATVLSADPVAKINSEYGLKLRQFTSAVWASTVWEGLLGLLHRVSQIMSFWSSATDPNRLSCNKCHATSSTTAVWPETDHYAWFAHAGRQRATCENGFGVNDAIFFRRRVNIPQAYGMIVASGQQVTVQVWVPGQSVTFFLVTAQS